MSNPHNHFFKTNSKSDLTVKTPRVLIENQNYGTNIFSLFLKIFKVGEEEDITVLKRSKDQLSLIRTIYFNRFRTLQFNISKSKNSLLTSKYLPGWTNLYAIFLNNIVLLSYSTDIRKE